MPKDTTPTPNALDTLLTLIAQADSSLSSLDTMYEGMRTQLNGGDPALNAMTSDQDALFMQLRVDFKFLVSRAHTLNARAQARKATS